MKYLTVKKEVFKTKILKTSLAKNRNFDRNRVRKYNYCLEGGSIITEQPSGLKHCVMQVFYFHDRTPNMVNIACRADGLLRFVERELMGDDSFQIPLAACHDLLHISLTLHRSR